jgi:hypothetical protein
MWSRRSNAYVPRGKDLLVWQKLQYRISRFREKILSLSVYFTTKPEKGKFVCGGFSEIRMQADCLNFKRKGGGGGGVGELNPQTKPVDIQIRQDCKIKSLVCYNGKGLITIEKMGDSN